MSLYQKMETEEEASVVFDLGDEIDGAGFWIRAAAKIIDIIIHTVISIIAAIIVAFLGGIYYAIIGMPPDQLIQQLQNPTIIYYIFAFIGATLFYTLSEGLHGSTLGKIIFGLVVVKDNGKPCGLLAALGRSLVILIDGFIFGIPAAISMASSYKHQRLGDRLVGTMVVKRSDVEGEVSLRSGLRFIGVFLLAVMVDGMIVGTGQIIELLR